MPSLRTSMSMVCACSCALFLVACSNSEHGSAPVMSEPGEMMLTSTMFAYGEDIPIDYTCDGANVNPPLAFENVPEDAKSLVLIMEDPDVPLGIREDGMWDHWVVFNIPPTVTGVAQDEQPEGVAGQGTTEKLYYKGPCPPAEHRYYFKLFALDKKLKLKEGAYKQEVLDALENHVLAEAVLMGRYDRPVNKK